MEQLVALVVIPLLATLVAVVRGWLQTNITPKRLSSLVDLTRIAVAAADEVDRAAVLPSEEKFAYAEQALVTAARRIGIRLRAEEANAFIHAVLNEAHQLEGQAVTNTVPAILDGVDDLAAA